MFSLFFRFSILVVFIERYELEAITTQIYKNNIYTKIITEILEQDYSETIKDFFSKTNEYIYYITHLP